jgi:hypothetical protein
LDRKNIVASLVTRSVFPERAQRFYIADPRTWLVCPLSSEAAMNLLRRGRNTSLAQRIDRPCPQQ